MEDVNQDLSGPGSSSAPGSQFTMHSILSRSEFIQLIDKVVNLIVAFLQQFITGGDIVRS